VKGHEKHALHAKATPNPLNPQTKLTFTLSQSGRVRVLVYDARGRYVKTLLDENRYAGDQTLTWDGSDSRSRKVSSGVYMFRIVAPEGQDIQRVTVLK
jgi:flagellar hook assembly protein FlgD